MNRGTTGPQRSLLDAPPASTVPTVPPPPAKPAVPTN
jgi:hypothetical protein